MRRVRPSRLASFRSFSTLRLNLVITTVFTWIYCNSVCSSVSSITEIMCLRAKGTPESTATFSVEVAGQVYNQTNEFVYLGEKVNHNADLSIEVDRCIRNA